LVKQLRRGPAGSRSVVGLLPDNTWALVPEWMTSREACAHCQLTEVPAVSLLALLELAAALDALPLGGLSSTISSKTDVVEEAGENGGKTRERQLESPAARAGVGGANRLVALPAQIRLQLRDELARPLIQLAMGGGVEVDDDDGER